MPASITLMKPAALALLVGASSVASFAARAATATVVSSTPVVVSVSAPRQVCSDGQQLVQQRPSGAGAVIGAIAGGVIGHQFGGGFGRAAATGIGAVAGAAVGDSVEAANSPVAEVPVRRCQTVASTEQRVVGYDVVYEYAGQRYSTRMNRDPGQQLAISVQPADAGGLPADAGGLPAPVDAGRAGTPVPAVGAAPQAVYDAPPQTVYYPQPAPAPVYYYTPSPYYIAPVIGFGLGYYGGYYRGGYRGHWR